MASINYTGRSVDLFIFQGATPVGEAEITLALGSETGGKVTTGIQKLSQSYAILFLTERGTIANHPDLGTEFVTAVRQGRILDESDVKGEFLLANELIQQTLDLEADKTPMPEDEQLRSAELVNFVLDKAASKLTLKVKVNSVAGTSREVYLPMPIAIQ